MQTAFSDRMGVDLISLNTILAESKKRKKVGFIKSPEPRREKCLSSESRRISILGKKIENQEEEIKS